MFRTLTDPGYQKATNKHGCRLNPRSGTPMHVMATYALQQLPGAQRHGLATPVLLLKMIRISSRLAETGEVMRAG